MSQSRAGSPVCVQIRSTFAVRLSIRQVEHPSKMKYQGPNRRREPRFPIETDVNVERQSTGEHLTAKSVNIGGGGMLLEFDEPAALRLGETVTCSLKAPDDPDKPLPSWGVGNVVRAEDRQAAVELEAGAFAPESDSEEH
jgi:hypothetical protein